MDDGKHKGNKGAREAVVQWCTTLTEHEIRIQQALLENGNYAWAHGTEALGIECKRR